MKITFFFWPDLDGTHYSDDNTEWISEYFNFVGKQINTSNVAQVRPPGGFWGDLAQKVYSDG